VPSADKPPKITPKITTSSFLVNFLIVHLLPNGGNTNRQCNELPDTERGVREAIASSGPTQNILDLGFSRRPTLLNKKCQCSITCLAVKL
jgi:hypothetical protein